MFWVRKTEKVSKESASKIAYPRAAIIRSRLLNRNIRESVKSEACVDADDSVEAGLSPFPFHGVKIENKVTGERDWCRFILAWVSGLIWSEVKQLWDVGLEEYVHDMWNVIDFVTNSLYVATVALRVVAYYRVQKENEGQLPGAPVIELQREQWDTWDPMLISEGLFSAANIFR